MEKRAQSLSMPRARRSACRMNITSFLRTCMTTSPSTRKSCSPITTAGKKLTTRGARKILTRRSYSMMGSSEKIPSDLLANIPEFPKDAKLATRKAGGEVLQPIAQAMPVLISGSADLYGSTMNYIKDGGDFERNNPGGRNIRFGIREHGMCAILNGISCHGLFRASGATFTVFTDYCRASIRLSALAKLPNLYIFTHDSIGVGEDGPTHQPVETVSSVRLIPNIDVIRPADPEETAGAFDAAMQRTDVPTFLALTRQAA